MSKEVTAKKVNEQVEEQVEQKIPYDQFLVLLLKSVKSLGIEIDIILLDVILSLEKEVAAKGKSTSLADIEKVSQIVVAKYQQPQQ